MFQNVSGIQSCKKMALIKSIIGMKMKMKFKKQWNPSGKARNVSLKLRNVVHFHSLQIMFILPLITDHLFRKDNILGGLYRGVPLQLSLFL